MKQLIKIIKSQMHLILICSIFLVLMFWVNYSIDKMLTENKRLKAELKEKYSLSESMDFYQAGYKKAYDRAREYDCKFFIEDNQFKCDSLMLIRMIKR